MIIGALVLSACGSKSEKSSGSGSKTLTLGVIAPLSGDLSAVMPKALGAATSRPAATAIRVVRRAIRFTGR